MFSTKEREEEGFTVHAGADEHSEILYLRPELVPPDYRAAESLTGKDFADAGADCQGRWMAGLLRCATIGQRGHGCARIRTFVAKVEGNGPANSGWPRLQKDSQIRRRNGSP
jgi:hypothetical protein